jgi:hypothetical protein
VGRTINRLEHAHAQLTRGDPAVGICLVSNKRLRASIASLEDTVANLSATRERLVAAQRLANLGDWVLGAAGRDLRRLDALGLPAGFRLSINVSARQFADADFIGKVSGALDDP